MKWEYIRFNNEIGNFVRVGTPIAFQEILTQLSFLALCAFINSLGLDASSGYGVANKIVNFIMLVPGSLMQSMASFVAQNVGAGQEQRAKRAMFTGMLVGGSIGIFIALLSFFRGDLLATETMFVMFQGLAQTFIVRLPMSYFVILNRKNAAQYDSTA